MRKLISFVMSAVMAAGIFSTAAFSYTGEEASTEVEISVAEDSVAEEIPVSTELEPAAEVVDGIAEAETVMETSPEDASLTPDGNLTLVDDIGSATGEGLQFITLVTKSGNTFYLIIDRNDDGTENVHFLNLVDEVDLLALMDEDEAAQYQTAAVEDAPVLTADADAEDEITAGTDTEKSESEGKSALKLPLIMLLLFAIGAAGVGGYLYMRVNGGKSSSKTGKPDPDADYRDEDEIVLPEDTEDSAEDDRYDEEIDGEYDSETDDEPV